MIKVFVADKDKKDIDNLINVLKSQLRDLIKLKIRDGYQEWAIQDFELYDQINEGSGKGTTHLSDLIGEIENKVREQLSSGKAEKDIIDTYNSRLDDLYGEYIKERDETFFDISDEIKSLDEKSTITYFSILSKIQLITGDSENEKQR